MSSSPLPPPSSRSPRIFVGAGEASGDRILAAVLEGLRREFPGLELRGFGGPLCAARGLPSLLPLRDLAVNGVGDVLRRGLFLGHAYRRLHGEMRAFDPDFVLLVDYPGMNVRLARDALRRGIPVHFIAPPQLWAYRDPVPRLRRLRAALGEGSRDPGARGASLQVLFPFEAPFYAPWARRLAQGHFFPMPAFEPARGTRLLLCPGSRRGVMRRNLPLWLPRVRAFFGTLEGVDLLVPQYLEAEARRLCETQGAEARVLTDDETAFRDAGAAIAFPGTMTLDLFLRRIPVRAWAVLDPLTLWLGRRTLRGPWIALPNIIAGEGWVPEWIGTARDFAQAPPEIPERIADWNRADGSAVGAVWEKMGADDGVEKAVSACTELLRRS
jgi:lipid-A-disaccharide synthase